jgi:putative oxidoreductase
MNEVIILVGRLMFALIFILAAPRHFSHEGIQHAADLGVPMARLLVPLSGVMALLGGLSIALGYKAPLGAWLLVGFLVPVTFMMHGFWKQTDPVTVHVQQAMFVKNLAMLGAALLITQLGSGPFSLGA